MVAGKLKPEERVFEVQRLLRRAEWKLHQHGSTLSQWPRNRFFKEVRQVRGQEDLLAW